MEDQAPKKRVISYIDGFNLYKGLCDANYRRYLWLDLQALSQRLIRPDQELVATKYFTSRISGGKPSDRAGYAAKRDGSRKRQTTFLDALSTISDLEIFYGHYREEPVTCNKCRATWMDAEEKMTDVNIATEMLVDSYANRCDVILLISGDSDLVPPIKAIKNCFGWKRINVAFPPERSSYHLRQEAHGQCVIGRGTLKKSQFEPEIRLPNGRVLAKPVEWV
jgi:uncharacterized LabA/DUF88 family protein